MVMRLAFAPSAVTPWILTGEPNTKAALIPYCGSTAARTRRVLRSLERSSLVFEIARHANEATKLTTGRAALAAQHALVSITMGENIERTVPKNTAVED